MSAALSRCLVLSSREVRVNMLAAFSHQSRGLRCSMSQWPSTHSSLGESTTPSVGNISFSESLCRGDRDHPVQCRSRNTSLLHLNVLKSAISRSLFCFGSRHGGKAGMTQVTSGISRIGGMLLLGLIVAFSAYSADGASTPEDAFVRKTISSHEIVIFSKTYCPYCKRAKAVFKNLNKTPHVVELDKRDDGENIQAALSGIVRRRTVPQVFIKGKHIGGSDDTIEAYENGTIGKLLNIDPEVEL